MPKALENLRKKIAANLKGKTNPRTKKPYTDSEIWAIAQAQFKKRGEGKAERKICLISNVSYKSIEVEGTKQHHIYGFVSAPCVDDLNDLIPESLQPKIVDRINLGFANRGSWNHDNIREGNFLPIASAKAELKEHPKLKKQAAYVDVTLDPASPRFDEVLNYAQKDLIKGFSLEYPKDVKTHDEMIDEKTVRVFDDIPSFGFGIVGGEMTPVNQLAYADGFEYKAYFNEQTEVKGMPEDKDKEKAAAEKDAEEKKAEEKEAAEKAAVEEKNKDTAEGKAAELEEFKQWKTQKAEESRKVEFKALVDEQVKVAMKDIKPANIPMLNPVGKFEGKAADDTIAGYKAILDDDKADIASQYRAAAKLHNQLDNHGVMFKGMARTNPQFEITGPLSNNFAVTHLEYKAQLEHDTNKVSDTDYYQNAAELRDIYDPVIRSHLNDKTTTYGLLKKIDASEYPDRYGFTAYIARVAGAGGSTSAYYYDEGDALTGYYAQMLKCQIPFKWYAVVLQVSGQMVVAARGRGGVGDIFSKQVERGSADLLKGINVDIFYSSGSGDSGMTAGSRIMSLPYLLGTSELYGLDRSGTYTTLQGTTTPKSNSPNPAKTDLRTAIRTVENNGANRNDLAFVCDPIQKDKILGLLDEAQRLTTVPRAGFEGLPSFDGIPIFSDPECDNGYIYLLDLRHTYLAVQLAPTYEDLAKTDDSKKGFIKTYFALVCTAPNHNYLYTGFATT